jgi:hypothetical protein
LLKKPNCTTKFFAGPSFQCCCHITLHVTLL